MISPSALFSLFFPRAPRGRLLFIVRIVLRLLLVPLLLCIPLLCHGEIVVRDDSGQTLRLLQPARRIVSLAPHLTESLFAAGAGDSLIATVDYSDYPPPARRLPRLGSYDRIDLEALLASKPDLVIVWQSSTPASLIRKIQALGLRVYVSQSNRIENLANDLERFGLLAGHPEAGAKAAQLFRQRLAALRARYNGKPVVRVFYELWNQPLITVGGPQVISDVIRLCGGRNVFESLNSMAPAISSEAVLAAEPEAIIASGMDAARPQWLEDWKKWPSLPAVARDNLFHIHPDLMHRHTPRLLDGTEQLCQQLELARQRRK